MTEIFSYKMQARKEIELKNDMKELGKCPVEGIGMELIDNETKSWVEEWMKSMGTSGPVVWSDKNGSWFKTWKDPYSKMYCTTIKWIKKEKNEAKEKEHKLERK